MSQLDLFGGLRRALTRPTATRAAPKSAPATGAPRCVTIDLDGVEAVVRIYRSRAARHFTVSLARDRTSLRLTLPARAAEKAGLAFVAERRALLRSWLQDAAAPARLTHGTTVLFKGQPHLLVWAPQLPRRVEQTSDQIRVGGPAELMHGRVLRWLKAQALADLTQMTQAIAAQHQLTVRKVTVNAAATRWGSCSSSGQINYSWRLICAPDAARRYVVTHELAHLTHMNHAPAFWREVTRLGGDLGQRRWFRQHGAAVMALG